MAPNFPFICPLISFTDPLGLGFSLDITPNTNGVVSIKSSGGFGSAPLKTRFSGARSFQTSPRKRKGKPPESNARPSKESIVRCPICVRPNKNYTGVQLIMRSFGCLFRPPPPPPELVVLLQRKQEGRRHFGPNPPPQKKKRRAAHFSLPCHSACVGLQKGSETRERPGVESTNRCPGAAVGFLMGRRRALTHPLAWIHVARAGAFVLPSWRNGCPADFPWHQEY